MAAKRSGKKAKPGNATRREKSKVKPGLKDLQVKDAKEVRGGRKAGEKPMGDPF